MKTKTSIHTPKKSSPRWLNHVLAGLMCVSTALLLAACGIVRPSAPAFVAEEGMPVTPSLVQLDFEYEDAEASEVALLWNLKAETDADASSADANAAEAEVMQTKAPMHKEGDLFTTHIAVPEGAPLEFSLLITTDGAEGLVEVQHAIDEDQIFTAARYGLVRILSVQTLNQTYTYSIFLPTPEMTQEIVYRAADAGEVYLVWTVNDWQLLPTAMRSDSTMATDRYMYMPMTMQDDGFHANVSAPTGARLNYSFVTTKNLKGAPVQVWETLADDQQPVITADGRVDVVATTTAAEAAAVSMPLAGAFTPPIATLIGLASLFGAALLAKYLSGRGDWTLHEAPLITVAATGLSLYAALILIRIYVAGIGWVSWQTTLPFVTSVMIAAIPDLIYAIVVSIAFCMLLMYAWPAKLACRLICAAFSAIMVVSVAFALANAITMRTVGQPIVAGSALWATLPTATMLNLFISVVTLSATALMASDLPQVLLSLFLSRPLAASVRKHYVYVPVGKFNGRTRGANQPLQSMLGRREEMLLPYNPEW
ncbi:MAG: hypothetical protein R2911_12110 [Caldilineaceae bacterium]